MADITTAPAAYGDTNNDLLFKIAWKFYGDLPAPVTLQAPQYMTDSDNTLLLKIAQYLELL